MNIKDALHHAVHDYKDGVEALARRMGLAVPTLYGMANPNSVENGWPLKRFQQVLLFTGDMRPLHALCEENGGVFVPVVDTQDVIDAFKHFASAEVAKRQAVEVTQNPCCCVPDSDNGTLSHVCKWHEEMFSDVNKIKRMAATLTVENAAKLPADKLRVFIAHGIRESTLRKKAESELAELRRKLHEPTEEMRVLMRFYSVDTIEALAEAQARHVEKLQAKLPPLKDEHSVTFPRG